MLYTLYSILYTLYSILYALYSVLYTLYSILYTLYSILYTLYSIRYTLYSTLYTLYSILYTLYSILMGQPDSKNENDCFALWSDTAGAGSGAHGGNAPGAAHAGATRGNAKVKTTVSHFRGPRGQRKNENDCFALWGGTAGAGSGAHGGHGGNRGHASAGRPAQSTYMPLPRG